MAETRYQELSTDDRRDALEVAERSSSHKAHLLEKDIWVVAALDSLFESPFAQHLTFKGGTSLSKVWRASRAEPSRIRRSHGTGSGLALRKITRATDERTGIFAMIPVLGLSDSGTTIVVGSSYSEMSRALPIIAHQSSLPSREQP